MTTWNTNMDDRPEGRPILLKMNAAPIGWSIGGGESVTIGQVGNGNTPGIWIAEGFFADKPPKNKPGSEIFIAWAEIPA